MAPSPQALFFDLRNQWQRRQIGSLPSGSLTSIAVTDIKQVPAQLNIQGQIVTSATTETHRPRVEATSQRGCRSPGTDSKVGSQEDGGDVLMEGSESSREDLSQATGGSSIY